MDDQRMLELAAKAAGMIGGYAEHFGEVGIARSHTGIWNPLTDDADAFRLAVKLQIDISFWPDAYVTCVYPEEHANAPDNSEPLLDDPCATTRRAITRAAAEIQLAKESGK